MEFPSVNTLIMLAQGWDSCQRWTLKIFDWDVLDVVLGVQKVKSAFDFSV